METTGVKIQLGDPHKNLHIAYTPVGSVSASLEV